ncbi:hypothetical protein [Nonomuraea turcica]|uniref:hypothetical protein n=1 Tax=Nonomuraea sp. G32 TaxID=3067274 RepID=UPI00273C9C44|nr:hypothetical protein [Nonomuraea sp. G32]MDP4511019.1 hypothetical protein [Nonomuraea sp. G32]
MREAGAEPLLGSPFTALLDTLTAIGLGAPSWTVFYQVGDLPSLPRVAIRTLAAPTLITSLAVPPGPPTPGRRHLLQAIPAQIKSDRVLRGEGARHVTSRRRV